MFTNVWDKEKRSGCTLGQQFSRSTQERDEHIEGIINVDKSFVPFQSTGVRVLTPGLARLPERRRLA